MIISNIYNLPEAVYNTLVEAKPPVPGRYSVTDLINAPLQRILKMKHWPELTQDVSDMLWLLLGKATHYVLEHGAPESAIAEEKLTIPWSDTIVVGVADLYHNYTVEDYKITSVYAFLLGDKPEWERQLNIYAWIYRQLGFDVYDLLIRAILRDWVKTKALKDAEYPPIPFQTVRVPLWDASQASTYVEERIALHRAAEDTMDAPCCTDEERWAKPTTYAVMKKGNKRAARVLDSMDAAETWAVLNLDAKDKYEIQERAGEFTKCASYCLVRDVCPHNPYRDKQEEAA